MSLGNKRSASPLPSHLDDISWIRLSDKKKRDSSPEPSFQEPQNGQEMVSLSPFVQHQHNLRTNESINDIILRTTSQLAHEGKRLTRAPRLLAEGIAFDWVHDTTAQESDIQSLLSVEGIRCEDLQRVLLRATSVPTMTAHTSRRVTKDLTIPTGTQANDNGLLIYRPYTGTAFDPIVIGDDPAINLHEYEHAHSHTHTKPPVSDSQVEVPQSHQDPTVVRPTTASPSLDAHVRKVLSHAEQKCTSTEPLNSEDRLNDSSQPQWSVDRSTVASYATRRSGSPARENVIHNAVATTLSDDLTEVFNVAINDPFCPRDLPRVVDVPSNAKPGNRNPDYGEWKRYAEDSSDAEMDSASSVRESSPDKTFPLRSSPQSVPGLPFLPQTYDTSSLRSQAPSLTPSSSSSRSGLGVNGNSSYHERERPSPRCVPGQPHRSSYRLANQTPSALTHNPPVLPFRRHRPVSRVHSSRNGRNDYLEDNSDNSHRIQKPAVSLPRFNTASRNLRKDQSNGPAVTRKTSSNSDRSPSYPQPPFPGRSSSTSSERVGLSSEDEVDQRSDPSTTGHTVVIPKANFARGRRLLVPTNQDYPLTTILMRGEAHFIDQRSRTRVSEYSLHVEEQGTRHVEDACLLGDGMVVVGYDKGPYQVSLISVKGDQRPSRIDLSYKAHTTVIENRSVGKAYPNPGIACVAPVSDSSFLSGGHDKTVCHWNLTRSSSIRRENGGYSATSTRIPTEHTQPIQALAYSTWNNTVYTAAGDRIAATNISARIRSEPERVSGKITQVHVHPQDPRLIALEIDHMDHQVQLYDMREGGFARRPWLEFGYRAAAPRVNRASGAIGIPASAGSNASARPSSSRSTSRPFVPKLGSRYLRGSTTHSLFARGYSDGVVLVWDFRNGGRKEVLKRFQFQRPAEIAHTVLVGSDVIVYGGYSVTFWSTLAASDPH